MKNYKCQCYYIETTTSNVNTDIIVYTNNSDNEVYIKDLRVVDNSSTTAEKNINVWIRDNSAKQSMLSVRNQKIVGGSAIVLSKKNIPLNKGDALRINCSAANIGISFSILSFEN